MRSKLLISLIGAVVGFAALYALQDGCGNTPPSAPAVPVIDTLLITRTDTVVLPSRLVYRDRIIDTHATVDAAQYGDSIRALRERLNYALMALAQYEWLSAEHDTVLIRHARATLGGRQHDLTFPDSVSLRYDYPPVDRFRFASGEIQIHVPDTIAAPCAEQNDGRPWWVDVLLAVGGAATAIVLQLIGDSK